MSEHRKTSALKGRCPYWPDCLCRKNHDHWYDMLLSWIDPTKPPATLEQLEHAEVMVYMALSCISANCPSQRIRQQATIELLKPFYERQRRIDQFNARQRGEDLR